MEPKDRTRIEGAVGGLTLIAGLLRGKSLTDAQAEARAAIGVAGPIADELAPLVEGIRAQRQAKKAAEEAAKVAPRCGVHAGIVCVLAPGHLTTDHPYHQDEHGTLFQ